MITLSHVYYVICSKYVCDGEPDCKNGFDETNCNNPKYSKYISRYASRPGFKILTDKRAIAGINVEECAKFCTQTKHCDCHSFSYNIEKQKCLLGM